MAATNVGRVQALRQRIGAEISDLRSEAGATQRALAQCAGIDQGYLSRIEDGRASPSIEVLSSISSCLGADLGIRLFPTTAPLIVDRFQAPMIEALLRLTGSQWNAQPEVSVPAARGVIDLVLTRRLDGLRVACECHSELRRLEHVLRRSSEKTQALGALLEGRGVVSSLLLLRSTVLTRSVAATYGKTLEAAFPARSLDALDALSGDVAWPGPAIVWARVERGRAEILERPPRGVRIGR